MPILPYEGNQLLSVNLKEIAYPLTATYHHALIPKQPVPILVAPGPHVVTADKTDRTCYRLGQAHRPQLELRLPPIPIARDYGEDLMNGYESFGVSHPLQIVTNSTKVISRNNALFFFTAWSDLD